MAYRDNTSPHPDRWTNLKLIAELRKKANLQTYCSLDHNAEQIREATRVYRESWVNPLINEIEKRLCPKQREVKRPWP